MACLFCHVSGHWLAINISETEIAENASIDNIAGMARGKNNFNASYLACRRTIFLFDNNILRGTKK